MNKANIFGYPVHLTTQEDGVNKHEDLHQQVAGSFAKGKTIETGSDELGNAIATGGHVEVKMPPSVTFQAPMSQIEKAEQHARIIAESAIAPASLGGDAGILSAADQSVYAQATSAIGAASSAKSQRTAFEGQIAQQSGQKPDKNQELRPEDTQRKPLNIIA